LDLWFGEVAVQKITDAMLGYALRLVVILLAGWLLVELVYGFHSWNPKAGDHMGEPQRVPLPNAQP